MEVHTDFSKITPCGGDCSKCKYFIDGICEGCLQNGGKCVHMWDNGCEIFSCCQKHEVRFCGLCEEFPCEFITKKIHNWDKNGILRLAKLAEEYRSRQKAFEE